MSNENNAQSTTSESSNDQSVSIDVIESAVTAWSESDSNDSSEGSESNSEENSEETNSETQTNEESDSNKKVEPVSKAWVKIQQKERQLLEQSKQLKESMQKVSNYEQVIQSAKKNPIAFLESAGLSLQDLTTFLTSDAPKEDPRDAKIKELEEFKNSQLKQQEVSEANAIIESHKNELNGYINENIVKYPLINSQKATGVVWDVIEEHALSTGATLSPSEACEMVEAYYKNIQDNMQSGSQSREVNTAINTNSVSSNSQNGNKTLSNSVESSPASITSDLTEEEKIEAAIKLMNSF